MPRSTVAGGLIAVAVMVILSSCVAPSPTPVPTSSTPVPSTAADPTPTAEADPLSTVAALVMRPEVLQLAAADGAVVAELDYLSAPVDAITALSAVFESEPTDEEFPGSGHFPPSTAHRWGDFTLWEQHYVDNWANVAEAGPNLFLPAFKVQYTGPEAMGVMLKDVDDRHVGGSWADLMSDPGLLTNPSGCSGPYVDYVTFEVERPDGVHYAQKVSVDFVSTDDDASIERIGAPMPVYEDGCA
jgi:hypothetical protein